MEKLLEVLKQGGVILYPTDTIWGLGCDAANPEAIQKLFSLKKREQGKSAIILVENEQRLQKIVEVPAKRASQRTFGRRWKHRNSPGKG